MISRSSVRAFTLIELLVVIAIIGILSAVVFASLDTARAKSRDSQRVAQLRQIQTALEMQYADTGAYPTWIGSGNHNGAQNCSQGRENWIHVMNQLVSGGYLTAVPTDPLNTGEYCYFYLDESNTTESGVRCNGVRRTDYRWSVFFKAESGSPSGFPIATFPGTWGTELNRFCMVGPLK